MNLTSKRSEYTILKELGFVINKELQADFSAIATGGCSEAKIVETLRKEVSNEEIASKIASIQSVGLGITEECNFRCEYCIYSGNYLGYRKHKNIVMKKEIAFKTIEVFLELLRSSSRTTKGNEFDVSFYGGEALLVFDSIKDVVAFADARLSDLGLSDSFKLNYRITTNGYLLNKESVEYLVTNDFYVNISLDGPEEEHDKLRLMKNKIPTWQKVMDNISFIKSNYPDYFKKRVSFQCTIHPFHDEEKLFKFFEEHFRESNVQYYFFNRVGLKKKRLAEIDKNRIVVESDSITSLKMIKNISDNMKIRHLHIQDYFTASCFPGAQRVYVDSRGKYFMCEKFPTSFTIGSVFNGFDHDRIRQFIKQYNEEIVRKRCWECDVWFMCKICYANSIHRKSFKIECESFKEMILGSLVRFINLKEEMHEKSQPQTPGCGTVSEFMRCLQ